VTYEEAAELAFFGAQVLHPISMQPAIKTGIPVRVKNSYNPSAPGTLITATRYSTKFSQFYFFKNAWLFRDKKDFLVTAITSKSKVQLIDIVSTRMLGQYGFLSKVQLFLL
jgi:aspartate kinase